MEDASAPLRCLYTPLHWLVVLKNRKKLIANNFSFSWENTPPWKI